MPGKKITIAVTGTTGLVGGALISELTSRHFNVIRVPRLSLDVKGADCVIHCAGLTNFRRDGALVTRSEYSRVNVQNTLDLAFEAAALGVRRFIFLSSVKVIGESTDRITNQHRKRNNCDYFKEKISNTSLLKPFGSYDLPVPQDPYAISKLEAEQGLWKISSLTGIEVVVIRSPLVYGPGVKGNLARLLALVLSGVPLPLNGISNRRSMIAVDNLVDLLIRCVRHPAAASQTLMVSDGRDLSTPELLQIIAGAMGRPVRLFSVPVPLLRLLGRSLGRLEEVERLVGSLHVDISITCKLLGWVPPISVEEGVKRMVVSYLSSRGIFWLEKNAK